MEINGCLNRKLRTEKGLKPKINVGTKKSCLPCFIYLFLFNLFNALLV